MARIFKADTDPRTGRVRYGVDYVDPETRKRRRRVVGEKTQALRALAKLEEQRIETEFFGGSQRTMTIAEMARLHTARVAHLPSARDVRRYWRAIEARLGAERRVSTIRPTHLIELRAALLATPTRFGRPPLPATVNRCMQVVKAGLRIAVEENAIPRAPVPRGLMLNERNERDRVVTEDELRRLLAKTRESTRRWPEDPEMRLAIIVAIELGLRQAEVSRLTRSDITETTVRVQISKTDRGRRRGRTVPITDAVRAAIEAHPTEALFTSTPSTLSQRFHRLTLRCGISGLRFHDLRHSCATRLVSSGVDVFALMRSLGWSNVSTAMRYVHTGPQNAR